MRALLVATFSIVLGCAAAPTTERYGLCDASAALIVDGSLWVADDETNQLFRFGEGTQPTQTLLIDDGKEIDFEAVAYNGTEAYWIGSHAANREGKRPRKRRTVVITRFDESGGARVERSFESGLRQALEQDARYGFADFEIEAASFSAAGDLWIGLRAPLRDDSAWIVPVLAPVDLEQPQLGDPILLSLDGHGLRAMSRLDEGWWLLAAKDLYLWDGVGEPQRWLATPWQVEAVAPDRANRRIALIADDGTREIDGQPCKRLDSAARRFRGRWIDGPEQVY